MLYALGKVKSAKIIDALPTRSKRPAAADQELRDSATRALGKFAESIPAGRFGAEAVAAVVERLRANLADGSPAIRAKAVRSLGKLARYGHLTTGQRDAAGRNPANASWAKTNTTNGIAPTWSARRPAKPCSTSRHSKNRHRAGLRLRQPLP